MKFKSRKVDAPVAGSYQEIGRPYDDPCVYCGSISSCYDHVPPVSFASRMAAIESRAAKLRKYPACVECNSILGGSTVPTMEGRQKLVRQKLASRYQKVLRTPEWTEDELREVSDALATDIKRHARLAAQIRQRLAWGDLKGKKGRP